VSLFDRRILWGKGGGARGKETEGGGTNGGQGENSEIRQGRPRAGAGLPVSFRKRKVEKERILKRDEKKIRLSRKRGFREISRRRTTGGYYCNAKVGGERGRRSIQKRGRER